MNIFMIGPGLLPIPPQGWGAIESVIWDLASALRRRGHSVTIINTKRAWDGLKFHPWRADVVHCHYDPHLGAWLRMAKAFRLRLISTTHSPNAARPWTSQDSRSFRDVLRCPEHFALSTEIAQRIHEAAPQIRVALVPNGVQVADFEIHPEGNGRAICLGRWEDRKRQRELWELVDQAGDLACDFVGPGAEELGLPDTGRVRYLGAWNRVQLRQRLGRYSVLLLASEWEAHALVTLEAQAAGIPLVVTPGAAANIDTSLAWVRVSALGVEFLEEAQTMLRIDTTTRHQIRKYAERHLSWDAVAERYLSALAATVPTRGGLLADG